MTHWFITKAKAQEIQCDDPMEALREWFPDLYAERMYIFQFKIFYLIFYLKTQTKQASKKKKQQF